MRLVLFIIIYTDTVDVAQTYLPRVAISGEPVVATKLLQSTGQPWKSNAELPYHNRAAVKSVQDEAVTAFNKDLAGRHLG
jgi:hypothetical protein